MTLTKEKRGLTYVSVCEACELLVKNGYLPEKISLRDIRGETTAGSNTTIGTHRERWLRERRDAAIQPVHIDDSELSGLRISVEQLFAKKTADMRAEIEAGAAATRALVERLEIDIEDVLQINDQLQKQYEEAIDRAEHLEDDVRAANLRADELANANWKLGEARRRSLIDNGPVAQIPPELAQDAGADPLAGSGKEAAK